MVPEVKSESSLNFMQRIDTNESTEKSKFLNVNDGGKSQQENLKYRADTFIKNYRAYSKRKN